MLLDRAVVDCNYDIQYTESLNQDQLPQVKMPSDSQDCEFE